MRTFVELDKLGPRWSKDARNDRSRILGPHEVVDAGRRALAVRAFLPESTKAWVVDEAHSWDAPDAANPSGRYVRSDLSVERRFTPRHLHVLRTTDQRGQQKTTHDPYAFEPLLTGFDLHLLGEGRIGIATAEWAQLRTIDGIEGVNFAVSWPPNANAVTFRDSTLGTAAAIRCESTFRRGFGNCSCPV